MKKPEVCNPKVLAHTVKTLEEDPAVVRDVVSSLFEFVADTVTRGAFEGVEIPHFGKFRAKLKYVQQLTYIKSMPKARKPKTEQ